MAEQIIDTDARAPSHLPARFQPRSMSLNQALNNQRLDLEFILPRRPLTSLIQLQPRFLELVVAQFLARFQWGCLRSTICRNRVLGDG
jgi:hypothetical protein